VHGHIAGGLGGYDIPNFWARGPIRRCASRLDFGLIVSSCPWALAGLLLGLASIAYLVIAIRGVLSHSRYPIPSGAAAGFAPPISVLKPLCGAEADLYECLRSFCVQDYPHCQIVFGVADRTDTALPVVERLMQEFPHRDMMLLIDQTPRGTNPKVANLINMMSVAKHAFVVISDSDVRIDPECLRGVMAPLSDRQVGAVTCLYKGAPVDGLASLLGALFINEWFIPSVLVDAALNGIDFCFGPVTAVRRAALETIGGFIKLADHLADDFMLGQLLTRAGYRIVLSSHPVDTVVDESGLRSLIRHELRWARTVRTCRPLDHALSLVTQALPLTALLVLAWEPSVLGTGVLAAVVLLRLLLSRVVSERFALDETPLWLVPIRECLCFAVWAASLVGTGVRWRGRRFFITQDGRLIVPAGAAPRNLDTAPARLA
jgi:ceramide glucosyltransferase